MRFDQGKRTSNIGSSRATLVGGARRARERTEGFGRSNCLFQRFILLLALTREERRSDEVRLDDGVEGLEGA